MVTSVDSVDCVIVDVICTMDTMTTSVDDVIVDLVQIV